MAAVEVGLVVEGERCVWVMRGAKARCWWMCRSKMLVLEAGVRSPYQKIDCGHLCVCLCASRWRS